MMVQVKKIKKELKNEKFIKECAERFGLLGDLTKMKICYLLCYYPELTVSEIAEILKMPISRVSHALIKLKAKGIVSS
jgi:DNA-binding transcriptional ArsR family regulator